MKLYNHTAHIMQIDQFVRDIITTPTAFALEQITLEIQRLSPHLELTFQDGLAYAQTIKIYAEAIGCMRKQIQPNYSQSDDLKMTQYFVEYILSQTQRIKLQDQEFKERESSNRVKLETYLRQLLSHYARLLFVRVDLAIKAEYQHEVDIRQFQLLIQTMSNRYANRDRCFADLQGYAWAIEQGLDKGFHCHTLLIYDGNKHQNDFGLGLQVAQYWQHLTQNKGCCFVSNDPAYKQQFEAFGTLGIGMIHRNDPEQVENAIRTALYLVNPEKNHQDLRLRVPRMRTFANGQFERCYRRGL